VLPALLYEEHPGDGPISVLNQCGHLLLPGAIVTLRMFEVNTRGWPYIYTTSRSSVTIDSLPTSLQVRVTSVAVFFFI
jgi:hypothetical protein